MTRKCNIDLLNEIATFIVWVEILLISVIDLVDILIVSITNTALTAETCLNLSGMDFCIII